MKKLMALIALVAMVAVASVAQAQVAADVSGTITDNVDFTECLGATFLNLDTADTRDTAACTGTIQWNTLPGYTLDYNAASADLVHSNNVDALESGATCTSTDVECFSYKYVSSDPADTIQNTSTTEGVVPTVAEPQANGVTYTGDYGFEFYAVARTDTPAGTYSSSGTVDVYVTP